MIRIAKFLNKDITEEEAKRILEKASFKKMKEDPLKNCDWYKDYGVLKRKSQFLRKGTVGDWKNYFSEEQRQKFDERSRAEFEGSGLELDDVMTEKDMNLEDASLASGGARVKFSAKWLGSNRTLFERHTALREEYEKACGELAEQMYELEKHGVAPVAPDGKVVKFRTVLFPFI